jgi:hypothetical protein
MSPDELWAMMTYRKQGVEQTDMNETLRGYYRAQKNQAEQSKVA